MKTAITALMATVVSLGMLAGVASAQDGQGSVVAVIDIGKVFENHGRFNQRMEAIKKEVADYEALMEQKRNDFLERAKVLNTLNPSSPDYKQKEAQFAKEKAEMEIEAGQKRMEVLDSEAQVYLETYNEVVQAVSALAESNNISLVIRYDSTQIDPQDRGSVIKGVNRNVVLNRGYDLTEYVVTMVNDQRAAQGQGGPNRK